MADGDNVVLGQVNESSGTTTITGPLVVEDSLQVSSGDGVFSENLKVSKQFVAAGSAIVGSPDGGFLRVIGSFVPKHAGQMVVPPHGYSVSVPIDASGLVLATPQIEFDGTVSARLEGGTVLIEISKKAPSSGLPVSWFVFGTF